MLDWEFDEIIEDVQECMEDFNENTDPRDLVARTLDYYEDALKEGEIEKIINVLPMFIVPFKNLIMKTSDYNILSNIIEEYNLIDKNNLTRHQKDKLEEMIKKYDENIYIMKLWGRDENRREVFRQVVLDEEGNKKLVEIKEENDKY